MITTDQQPSSPQYKQHDQDHQFTHGVLLTGARTWSDTANMRQTFSAIWKTWEPTTILRPVLLSGACPTGADAMAESLWQDEGLDVIRFHADWSRGRKAGPERNQRMVNTALEFQRRGVQIIGAAFWDLCDKSGCTNQQRQLLPKASGHFSHGTAHCAGLARRFGLPVIDTIQKHSERA